MKDWYEAALEELKREINTSPTKRVSGSDFIRSYTNDNDLIGEEDNDDIETWLNLEIDNFEEWLKNNHSAVLVIGKNYYWSIVSPSHVKKQNVPVKTTSYDFSVANQLLDKELNDLNISDANLLYEAALEANKLKLAKAFEYAIKNFNYRDHTRQPNTDKLIALDAVLSSCKLNSEQHRADTYKYHCKKAEIYTSQYSHDVAAEEYKAAIQFLENEFNRKCLIKQLWNKTYRLFSSSQSKGEEEHRIANVEEILKSVYRKCRVQYQEAGMSDEASEIYVQESKHVQKGLSLSFKRIWMFILWALARYGESPRRVFGWGIIVIFGFALIYMKTGVNSPSGLAEFICNGDVTLHCTEQAGKPAATPDYWTHLYYSVVTFTTLGYGDFSPVAGESRFLSALQALFGLVLTSLFLGTLIKKYSR